MESAYKVFAGFYMFYYIDELGLAVAMAAIILVAATNGKLGYQKSVESDGLERPKIHKKRYDRHTINPSE
jgi:hypothetical protein